MWKRSYVAGTLNILLVHKLLNRHTSWIFWFEVAVHIFFGLYLGGTALDGVAAVSFDARFGCINFWLLGNFLKTKPVLNIGQSLWRWDYYLCECVRVAVFLYKGSARGPLSLLAFSAASFFLEDSNFGYNHFETTWRWQMWGMYESTLSRLCRTVLSDCPFFFFFFIFFVPGIKIMWHFIILVILSITIELSAVLLQLELRQVDRSLLALNTLFFADSTYQFS